MKKYGVKAFKGQKRVGKDATFQGAGEPQAIATREHNGDAGIMVFKAIDKSLQLVHDTMVHPGSKGCCRVSAHEGRIGWRLDQRQPGAIGVHGTGTHGHARRDRSTAVGTIRGDKVVGDASAQINGEDRTTGEHGHGTNGIGQPVHTQRKWCGVSTANRGF